MAIKKKKVAKKKTKKKKTKLVKIVKEIDNNTGATKDVDTKPMPSLFKHVRGSTNGVIFENHIFF